MIDIFSNVILIILARDGSRTLQALSPDARAKIIHTLANSLIERESDILAANKRDLDNARSAGDDIASVIS